MESDSGDDNTGGCYLSKYMYPAYLASRRRYVFLRLRRVLS